MIRRLNSALAIGLLFTVFGMAGGGLIWLSWHGVGLLYESIGPIPTLAVICLVPMFAIGCFLGWRDSGRGLLP